MLATTTPLMRPLSSVARAPVSSSLRSADRTLAARLQTLRSEQKVVALELRRQAEMSRMQKRASVAQAAAMTAVVRDLARSNDN